MHESRRSTTTPLWRTWLRGAALVALALLCITEAGIGRDETTPVAPTAVAGPAQIDNLAVITIEGAITAVTSKSFERRYNEALDAGAGGIVVEINSPGGEVGAVREITKVIKAAPVPTIAWINTDAYSGGAIIAIACDEIVIASGSMFGDAAAIYAGPGGIQNLGETERAKINAVLIAEVVDSAALNGYDEVLVTSLVMLRVETWLVENKDTGKRYFLTANEYKALFGTDPVGATPLVQSGGVDPASLAPLPVIEDSGATFDGAGSGAPQSLPDDASNALRALSDVAPESTIAAAARGITARSTRPDFAEEDRDDYRMIQYATDGNTLLTLNESGMMALGFTRYPNTIDTDEELKQYVAATRLVRLDQSWSEDFVAFATQGLSGIIFRGAMIVIFLLGLFVEMAMPGMGIAGVIAMVALAGLIVPPLMIDASVWWTLVAILGGIGLIALEILVIPGFGVAGVLGLGALLAGLIGTFAGAGELFPGAGADSDGRLGWAIATVFLSLFGASVGAYFVSKYTRSIPIARKLMLTPTLATYDTGSSVGMLGAMDGAPAAPIALGASGVTTTALRPEGEAEFDGDLFDVVSTGGFIDRATPVRVIEVVGNRVVVEPIAEASA